MELRDAMASLMEEIYEPVKTLNPQVQVTSKDQVELRDAMASLMEELYEAVKTLNSQVQVTSKSLGTKRCYGFSDEGSL